MRSSVRAAALLLTVVATGYILHADDTIAAPIGPQPSLSHVVGAQLLAAGMAIQGHEFFVSRLEIVPVGRRNITLPILMYHYVRNPPSLLSDWAGYKLSVSPADFAAQMDWLSLRGFHPVDFNDVRAYFAGKEPLPARPVVITLDDGYSDLYTTAFPILAAHGFKAVAYIVSSFVGQPRYVTASQLVQMDRNGIEIASHTVDHADLARSSSASTMRELVDSKLWLEHTLGRPVLDFAYPSGKFSARAVAEVSQAGYDTAVTTDGTLLDHSLADRFVWTRVRVGGGETLSEFSLNLGQPMPYMTITAIHINTAAAAQPPHARPTLQLLK
ncbi:MAG TPA: polysaccharide deacetylase family protein [Candidatus Dormibacteraeota bacterium]|nr:polysaccharide deacetylase family protein [Candidatus Dormibacteraeota bacterium]